MQRIPKYGMAALSHWKEKAFNFNASIILQTVISQPVQNP